MLNKTKKTSKAHENYMGGKSYDLSPFMRLYVMAASSFFGEDGYYSDVRCKNSELITRLEGNFGSFGKEMHDMMSGHNRAEAMRQAFEDSFEYDAMLTLKFLSWLRNKALMRATPAVGLAIASRAESLRGKGMVPKMTDVLPRMDDVTNCLSYYISTFGKPIPNGLKKLLKSRLESATEYELAKYAGKNKELSIKDVIRIVHANSPAIDKFCREEISQSSEGLETWESIISKEGSTDEAWKKAVGVMGHMALLRNLRNLESHHVPVELYLDKLVSGVKTGKQLPFRYYSAWQNVRTYEIREALEKCINISIENLPKFPGKSLILVDNSGSAQRQSVSNFSNIHVSTVGNLMGVLTGMVSDSGTIGVFGDRIKYMPVSNRSVLESLETVNDLGTMVGESTENGIWLALHNAIESREKFDRIFIYSDMQAGHGGLYGLPKSIGYPYPVFSKAAYGEAYIDVPKLVQEYREKVNPDCKLYSIQIGGYADNIFPEFYPNTCIVSGWSTEILKFAKMFEEDMVTVEEQFRSM